MNINKELIEILAKATNLEVEPDEYTGTSDKYITFSYEDEQPVLWGDNRVLADTAYIQIQLITPKNFNYLTTKHLVRDALEDNDYIVTSIQSFVGDYIQGTEKTRQTVFTVEKSLSR